MADHRTQSRQFWNRIPDAVREQVVQIALERPVPRELAWHITDTEGYFISESSTYRILKACDLVTSPVFQVVSAKDKFDHPTTRINELWQTDFTQLKVVSWGWYYLCTVLDDFSRYILIQHVRGAPYLPQTQGKMERYHRSMKSVVKLENVYFPWELEQAIASCVEYYNHHRYHESLGNVTPVDVYLGHAQEVHLRRKQLKQRTLIAQRQQHFPSIGQAV